MADDRRKKRLEIRQLSSESTWLQKALFALQKADEAREKLAEMRGSDDSDFELTLGRKKLLVDDFEEAIENRIRELLDTIRERRRSVQ